MKSSLVFAILISSVAILSGCGKGSSESSQSTSSATSSLPPEAKIDPIVIENNRAFAIDLGAMGDGDALLKKKLGTGVGKPIEIKQMFVWSIDSSEWEKGGKLHLITDGSLGRGYRIICSISPQAGDKFMETKKRRDVVATGIIKDYSSSEGLTIDPCNATWQSDDSK